MKYVIIGCSGHYHQALEMQQPAAIAKGSAGEDISGLRARCAAPLYEDYREMLAKVQPTLQW